MSLPGVVVGPLRKGGTTHSGRRRWRSSCLFARRPWRDCMGGPRIGKLPARLLQERRRWGQGCDPRPHHRRPPPLRRLAAGSTGESCRAPESHLAVDETRPLSRWPRKHDIGPHIGVIQRGPPENIIDRDDAFQTWRRTKPSANLLRVQNEHGPRRRSRQGLPRSFPSGLDRSPIRPWCFDDPESRAAAVRSISNTDHDLSFLAATAPAVVIAAHLIHQNNGS